MTTSAGASVSADDDGAYAGRGLGREGEREGDDEPVFLSSLASLIPAMIFLMDSTEPFLVRWESCQHVFIPLIPSKGP